MNGHISISSELTEIKDVGETENKLVVTITDREGADKAANYAIGCEYGTLKILIDEITIVTGSNTKVYRNGMYFCFLLCGKPFCGRL